MRVCFGLRLIFEGECPVAVKAKRARRENRVAYLLEGPPVQELRVNKTRQVGFVTHKKKVSGITMGPFFQS